MDAKLNSYRTKKRRQAVLNSFKDRLFNMVSFQQVRVDEKSTHVIVEADIADNRSGTKTVITPVHKTKLTGKTDRTNSDTESVLSIDGSSTVCSDVDEPSETRSALKPTKSYLTYITYLVYFLFWVTLYAIAIELRFGVVFLMLSALVAIYFNTRTEKIPGEISAYSVFNKNCESIDGTLKAEQFEREIGIRH
ncbi:uncharacterized protein LOC131695730 [Topomyia yanbarensis]|uniref:uncharacterized protein LOC131695730 n=1 Tax=Topomyia yanbarensis TaxID=2498891 RepID=UPI00273AE625|nr:uncharacterized protein LOC131695730 [Topomyia yanbarensis]